MSTLATWYRTDVAEPEKYVQENIVASMPPSTVKKVEWQLDVRFQADPWKQNKRTSKHFRRSLQNHMQLQRNTTIRTHIRSLIMPRQAAPDQTVAAFFDPVKSSRKSFQTCFSMPVSSLTWVSVMPIMSACLLVSASLMADTAPPRLVVEISGMITGASAAIASRLVL